MADEKWQTFTKKKKKPNAADKQCHIEYLF